MACLLLQGAPLPSEINDTVVMYLIDKFDDYMIYSEENIVNEIAILDFINRIFIADRSADIKQLFVRHGILLKLESVLTKLEEHNGHLLRLLSVASISVLYHLSTVPEICSEISANQTFVFHLLLALKKNESDSITKFAVSCLCNFTWFDPDLGLLFEELFGSEILLKTAKASSQIVKIDVLKIFSNFSLESNLTRHCILDNTDILKFVIEICNKYLENKLQFGSNADNLLKHCMIYLSNTIAKSENIKKQFYILGGVQMITRLLYLYPTSMLCRPFIQEVVKRLVHLKRGDPNQDLHTRKLYKHTKSYPPALKTVEENLADFRLYDGGGGSGGGGGGGGDPEVKDHLAVNCKDYPKKSDRCDLVDRSYKLQDRSYQYGATVSFIKDTTHAILPIEKRYQVKDIGQTVCGMLNCRRNCTLYFGISDSYRVVGVPLSRAEKDKFRLHCDQIFTQSMKPLVIANIAVNFKPLLDAKERPSNLHVIEISTFAQEIFYSFKNKTYFRRNDETQVVEAEMLRLMVIGTEFGKWKQEEKKWQNELDKLAITQRAQTKH